ncbi:MAG: ribosome-associated translation inhibitor RaiA [Clostridia bacterium]
MTFIMTQRKVEVEAAIKDYAEKKISKLERYFSKDSTANITFSELRENKIIEVTVKHASLYFRAQEQAKDFYTAVDKIVDILERQIRKHKTKLEKRLRDNAYDGLEVFEEKVDYDVVRRKHFDVESLTVDEAILQMEMLGHNFFFFRNAEDNDTYCVLYIRANGGYGIIES